MTFKLSVAILELLVAILYGIHYYLYLPDASFDAISFHFGGLGNSMTDNQFIARPYYERIYDRIDFFSLYSLIFALLWTTVICLSVISIIGYIHLMIYANNLEQPIVFNILVFPVILLLIYISIFLYEYYMNKSRCLTEYFTGPFQLDLTIVGGYYNNISESFYKELKLLLLRSFNLSIYWSIGLSFLYLSFCIFKRLGNVISSNPPHQIEQSRQEREAWLDADNRRIIQELKEYEAEEQRTQLARQQAKEQAIKEATLLKIKAQKMQEEKARIKLVNASTQNNIVIDSQDIKKSIHQDKDQDLDDFISVHDVGENYTSI